MTALQRLETRLSGALNRRGVYLGRRSGRIHTAIYRRTRGRVGRRMPGFADAEIVLVDHVGKRTGLARTAPLVCVRDGGTLVVAASKAGQPTHPAWYLNLRAQPLTTVQSGADAWQVRARVADERERARLWPQLVAVFPAFTDYEREAAPRRIPVVLLEPTA